ncbi:hypothetical protein Hanom_Chr13g01202981 [Helianthus anomalus]
MGVIETLPDLAKMRTRRRFRSRRVSEILKNFDAAEALLQLRGLSSEGAAGSNVPFLYSGENYASRRSRGDNGEGVTRLSANVLMQSFPSDRRGRCLVVYQRRPSGRLSATPAGVPMTASTIVGGEGENPWIIDPHPLEWYGEALHTPLEVLDMFPDP